MWIHFENLIKMSYLLSQNDRAFVFSCGRGMMCAIFRDGQNADHVKVFSLCYTAPATCVRHIAVVAYSLPFVRLVVRGYMICEEV